MPLKFAMILGIVIKAHQKLHDTQNEKNKSGETTLESEQIGEGQISADVVIRNNGHWTGGEEPHQLTPPPPPPYFAK